MTRPMTRAMTRAMSRLLAGCGLAAILLAGCGDNAGNQGGGGDVDASDAASALEAQRGDVRVAAKALVIGAVAALDGRATSTIGGFEGCESAFDNEFKNFRYRATGRIDAGASPSASYLDLLDGVFTAAGFDEPTPGERPGGRTLVAAQGDLTATFSELPEQGDYVLVVVEGSCIDVPEDDRAAWQGRSDPGSYL